MKKYGLSSTFLLLLGFLLNACSGEEINPAANTIMMDEVPFDISVASLQGISLENEGHVSITLTGNKGTTVKTLMINFEYSSSEPINGTYAFPQTTDTPYRYLDDWLTNYTELNAGGVAESSNLEKGKVTVKDNGDSNYTITIDFLMTDGKSFKGTYKGIVQAVFNNG